MTLKLRFHRDLLSRTSKLVVYLHPYNMLPRGDGDFPFNYVASPNASLFSESAAYIGITYAKLTIHLLPPPFSTACRPYGEAASDSPHDLEPGSNGGKGKQAASSFESSHHCLHRCLRHRTLQRFAQASFTSTFDRPRDVHIMDKYSVYSNRGKENTVDLMVDKCRQECPGTACVRTIFTPALISVREAERVTFLLYDMSGPEYRLYLHPSTSLMDLYVQLMSVCGVWLGISCIDVIARCASLCSGYGFGSKRRQTDKQHDSD